MIQRWAGSGKGKEGEARGQTAERKGAARGVVAVGWCGELGATVVPAQAARTRAMREESEAGASNARVCWGLGVGVGQARARARIAPRLKGRGEKGGRGPRGRPWRGGEQEASQSLAATAGLDRTAAGDWGGSGGASRCEERCVRECPASPRFQGPRFSLLLHQAAGAVVQHLLVCSCLATPSPTTCLPRNDAPYLTYSIWCDATRGGGWLVERGIVYFAQGGRPRLVARTCDLWGRLLQGEQQSAAARLEEVVAGWHEETAIAGTVWWLVRRERCDKR